MPATIEERLDAYAAVLDQAAETVESTRAGRVLGRSSSVSDRQPDRRGARTHPRRSTRIALVAACVSLIIGATVILALRDSGGKVSLTPAGSARTDASAAVTSVVRTSAPTLASSISPASTSIPRAPVYTAPDGSFAVGELPPGFVKTPRSGSVDAAKSPDGVGIVWQQFGDVSVGSFVVVSHSTGKDAQAQLGIAQAGPAPAIPRSDVRSDSVVYVWTDSATGADAMAWAAGKDAVVWLYGTHTTADQLAAIARSIEVLK